MCRCVNVGQSFLIDIDWREAWGVSHAQEVCAFRQVLGPNLAEKVWRGRRELMSGSGVCSRMCKRCVDPGK